MSAVINFIWSQCVWFLSLQGAGSGRPWLGAVAFASFIVFQTCTSEHPFVDLALAGVAALTGLLFDTVYLQAGLLRYAAPVPWPGVAPFWILIMWANFGLTLNSAMRWLQQHLWIGALVGVIGGPLAYLAGIRLGAAQLAASPWLVYGILGSTWAAALPGLLWVAARLAHGSARATTANGLS